MKKMYVIFLVLLLINPILVFSDPPLKEIPITSIDNRSGENLPLVKNELIIYSGGRLTVKTLSVDNNSKVKIKTGGVLIVEGNLVTDNQMIIEAGGALIVLGDFVHTSSDNQGGFTSLSNPSNVYILGKILDSVDGNELVLPVASYPVLNCKSDDVKDYIDGCNYGKLADLIENPIYQLICGEGLTGGSIDEDQVICEGGDVERFINVEVAGPNIESYQWYYTTDINSDPKNDLGSWTLILNATSPDYLFDLNPLSQTTYFVRQGKKGMGCVVYSNVVDVEVKEDNEDPILSGCSATTVIWRENFDYAGSPWSGGNDGVTWTGYELINGTYDRVHVSDKKIEAYLQGGLTLREWNTSSITISPVSPVSVSFDVAAWASNKASDDIQFQYQVDGGEFITFTTLSGAFDDQTITSPPIIGNSLKLKVVINRTGTTTVYYFDNVVVKDLEGRSVNGGCTYSAQGSEFDVTATDNCSLSSLAYNLTGATTGTGTSLSGQAFNQGLTTITWSATDADANTSTCSFDLLVTDDEAPTASDPEGIAVQCITDVPAVDITDVTDENDNCGVPIVAFVSDVNNSGAGTTASPYVVTRTYKVTDEAGNFITVEQIITVLDNEAPEITCPSDIEYGWTPAEISPNAWYDLNDASTVHQEKKLGRGTSVDDKSGNGRTMTSVSASTEGYYISSDPLLNNMGTLGNQTKDGRIQMNISNLSAKVCYMVVYYGDGTTTPSLTHSAILAGYGTSGEYRVTLRTGQTPWDKQQVFNDGSTYKNGSETSSMAALPMPATLWRFESTKSRSQNWKVLSGNNSSWTWWHGAFGEMIFTDGTESPAVRKKIEVYLAYKWGLEGELPANHLSYNSVPAGDCGTVVTYETPVGTDNCAGAITKQTAGLPSGSKFPVGITTNTFVVTDAAGHTATCSFDVRVYDGEAPTIVAPADVPVNSDAGICTASSVALGTPVIADNCGVATVENNAPTVFPLGETVVTWTVTDDSGLTATATQSVTVVDNEAPVAHVPSLPIATGECSASVTAPSATDNCKETITGTTADPTSYKTKGTYTITWTYDDGNGNTSTQTQTVIVTGPDLLEMSDDVTICEGETASLSVKDYSIRFDGGNDYVAIPNADAINTQVVPLRTTMLKFKADDITEQQMLYEEGGRSNGFAIFIDSGEIKVYAWNDAKNSDELWGVSSSVLSVGTWHHIAYTWNEDKIPVGEKFKVYFDGNLIGMMGAIGSEMPTHSGNIRLGCSGFSKLPDGTDINTEPSYFFKGEIDEFRLWNKELTQAEIITEMTSQSPLPNDLIVHYDFDDDTATGVTDETDGNDGEAKGGVTFTSDNTVLWNDPTKATTFDVNVRPTETTTYTATVTNENGCKNSGSVTVTVNPKPHPIGIFFD